MAVDSYSSTDFQETSVSGKGLDRNTKLSKHFKKRLSDLQDKRRPFEVLWDAVDDVILPYTYMISSDGERGNDIFVNRRIYDGEGINASITAPIPSPPAVMSRATPYFETIPKREFQDFDFQEQQEIESYCAYHERTILHELAKSNIYEEIVTFVKKGFDYGTTAMYPTTMEDGSVRYCTLGKRTYYIDEDQHGNIDTLYRDIWMTGQQIINEFSAGLASDEYDKFEKGEYNKYRVVHIVEKRDTYDSEGLLAVDKMYGSYYVLPSCSWKIVEESGFDAFPYFVWRQYREPGFVWGIGSGIHCIRDASVLQSAGRSLTDFANRSVDPAYALPKSVEGEEELFAGGRMFIDPEEAKAIVQIGQGSQYPFGIDMFNKIKDAVNRHYFVQVFQVMNAIRNQTKGADITATETDALKSESMTLLSSVTSGFFSQCEDAIIDDMTMRSLKTGALRPFKASPYLLNKESSGFEIGYEYTGSLAMAQKTFQKLSGADKLIQRIAPLVQIIPDILDGFDSDAYRNLVGEANNALNVLRSPQDVETIRKNRAQAQAQQYQAEMALKTAQVQAEVAAKGGQAPQQGSLAANMNGVQAQPGGGQP